jgi:hypothetical protein
MKEGTDEGRDCTLHLSGNAVGVVQCKCYEKDITKPEVAKEIIKFILYYLNGGKSKDLISDIKNFTYYFVVATDFNKEAATLIKGFNVNILAETSLEEWTKQVITKYKSLTCKYDEIIHDMKEVLKNIKIEMITEVDLHRILWTNYQNIISFFFKIKEVHIEDIDFGEALKRIYDDIEKRELNSKDLKEEILLEAGEILEFFHKRGEKSFNSFIKAIETPFPQYSFKADTKIKYKENIYNLANIIIHISLIKLAFPDIEFNEEIGKSLKISKDEYITYLYSEKNESYKTIVLNLIKHIECNYNYQIKGMKDVLIGSQTAQCLAEKPGAIFNMDGILKQFTKTTDGVGAKSEMTDLKNKYDFTYHCKNCLDFEWKENADEIKKILKEVLRGAHCGE